MEHEHLETISAAASKASYTGASIAVVSGISLNQLGVIIGMAVAIGGFLVNWYYRHKTYQLRKKEYEDD